MRSSFMLSILLLLSGIVVGASPVQAGQCITSQNMTESGVELVYADGYRFFFHRIGDRLDYTVIEPGETPEESVSPKITLGHNGLLRIRWNGIASGARIIEHSHSPGNSQLVPRPMTTYVTTRKSWQITDEGNRGTLPIAVEPLEFNFGNPTTLKVNGCAYDGLLLNTSTTLESGGPPLELKGVWVDALRLFVIDQVFREGIFDMSREIVEFRPAS